MKKLMLIVVGLAAPMACALAQGTGGALTPPSLNPKTVEPQQAPAISSQQPHSPRPNPEGDKPINPDEPNLTIKGIVLVKSRSDIKEAGIPASAGVHVQDIPFLDRPDFQQALQPFLGKLLTENRVRDLQDTIILYCRQHGKLLVDVILPEQNIENGMLQLWFLEGKVGKITVDNPGRKWFSDKLILDDVRLRPRDEVYSQNLTEDLDWLNNNPFRQVNVTFKPGEKLGLTDIQLQVDDRIPIRPYVGYENSGTRYTGVDRYLFGFNWGNVFGLDQQLNYQYLTDINFNLVSAHSGSYLIPLPWRHTLMFYGAYVDGRADFGGSLSAKGVSWQASMRYSIPLPTFAKSRHQVSAGFDFKRSNNDLESGGTVVLQHSDTDIAQFVLGYSDVTPDPYGQTSVSLDLFYSPGGLTQNNDDKNFNLLRPRAKADYFYGRLNVERITRLPYDFSWVLNGWGQWASERLLPSEELAVGGYDTVRGYDERVVTGDNGWIISNELRTPPVHVLRDVFHVESVTDQMQFLAFCDYGEVRVIDPNSIDDGLNPNKTLVGVGAGLRWMIERNLSLRFDYGFALTEKSINKHDSRAHIGLLLSF